MKRPKNHYPLDDSPPQKKTMNSGKNIKFILESKALTRCQCAFASRARTQKLCIFKSTIIHRNFPSHTCCRIHKWNERAQLQCNRTNDLYKYIYFFLLIFMMVLCSFSSHCSNRRICWIRTYLSFFMKFNVCANTIIIFIEPCLRVERK